MTGQPKFAELVAAESLLPQVEKGLLRGKFIKRGRLLSVGGFLFESGAILGHAFRHRFDVFVTPYYSEPGRPEAIEFAREEGRRVADLAPEASTLVELFMISEMRKDDRTRSADTWSQWLASRAQEKLQVDYAIELGTMYQTLGAGYATQLPERLEDLYRKSYSEIDQGDWHKAFELGVVSSPTPPEYVPLEEREQEAVDSFAEFCGKFYPDLLLSLGLEARSS